MIKNILFFLLIGVSSALGQAPYTNSWINYDQPYVKITIPKAGIYRLTGAQLTESGFPVATTQTDNIQLFYRGKEVPLRISKGTDGKLGATDFIEFFSPGNTGAQDSLVYRPASARPPTSYSLYSDDSYYFLTVSPTQKGKRVPQITFANPAATPEAFHLERQVKEYQDEWSFNNTSGLVPNLQQSYYERGEGWTGKMIKSDSLAKVAVTLVNRVPGTSYPVRLKALVNGRFEVNHPLQFFIGTRKFESLQFSGFDHRTVEGTLAENELDAQGTFTWAMQSQFKSPLELYSLTRYEVTYPQKFVMTGPGTKYFYLLPNASGVSTIAVQGLAEAEGNTALVYDVTEAGTPRHVESRYENGQLKMTVSGTATSRTLFVATQPTSVKALQKVDFKPYPTGFNYLVVTHAQLESSAQAYADYRRSEAGGRYNVLVVDTKDLYDQFNYGERGPLGIRNFLDYQLQDGKKDKYLLLVGNGVSFPDVLKTWQDRDFVPTFGYPGSDVLLSAGLGGAQSDSEAYRTGRLSASTNQQVLAYLAKVRETEATEADLSAKKILHLSGGKSVEEIARLQTILGDIEPLAEDSYLKGSVETVVKRTTDPVEDVSIAPQVNAGLGMITFMGHASPTVPDLNIGFASSPTSQLSNKGQYPFMYFNGCGVGNVFYRYETLATDWLMAPDRGAIGVLSNSFWSYAPTSGRYLNALYKALFTEEETLGKPIGEILQKVSHGIATDSPDAYDIANIHQLILLGDPALVVFRISKPDYSIHASRIFLQSKNPTLALGKADSLQVGVVLSNVGKSEAGRSISLQVKRTPNTGAAVILNYIVRAPALRDTIYLTFPNSGPLTQVEVLVDDKNEIDELRKDNNTATLALDWERAAGSVVYPTSARPDRLNPTMQVSINGKVPVNDAHLTANPTIMVVLTDENPMALDTSLIELYLKTCDSCDYSKVPYSQITYLLDSPNSLRATHQVSGGPGTYTLLVQGKDASGNRVGEPYRIRWIVEGNLEIPGVSVSPNPASYYAKFSIPMANVTGGGTINLDIYSLTGQLLEQLEFAAHPGDNEFYWLVRQPAGLYVYKIQANGRGYSGKIMVR
ncbi:putative type IX secretion system sortase PorU2 [Salmonirosea aquatica]